RQKRMTVGSLTPVWRARSAIRSGRMAAGSRNTLCATLASDLRSFGSVDWIRRMRLRLSRRGVPLVQLPATRKVVQTGDGNNGRAEGQNFDSKPDYQGFSQIPEPPPGCPGGGIEACDQRIS